MRLLLLCSVILAACIALGCAASNTPETPQTPSGPTTEMTASVEPGQSLDKAPWPVTWALPTYPAFALDAGIQGSVQLHALVLDTGSVGDVKVVYGLTGLNEASVNAAKKSIFSAAIKDGSPVEAWMNITVTYRLNQ